MVEQQAASELAKAAKPMQGPDGGSDWSNAPFTARCPLMGQTEKNSMGAYVLPFALIGLVQRSKHDPLLDHLVGAGAKAPPRVASAK